MIRLSGGIMLVEDKLDSEVDPDQLVDEFAQGCKAFEKTTCRVEIASLTADRMRPQILGRAELRAGTRIAWTSWTRCLEAVQTMMKREGLDPQSAMTLKALDEFLAAQQVEAQVGFSPNENWAE